MSLKADDTGPGETALSEVSLGFTLGDLDRDGAILDATSNVYGETRAQLLRKALFGSAALLAAFAAAPPLAAAGKKRDTDILNFDLVFEFLQSSFYLGGVTDGTVGRMRPAKQLWAHTLGAHELAHVKILKTVLGHKAVRKPFFNFRGVTESESAFTKTAVAMEDLTVALLAGQAPRFHDRALMAAVFSLLTVEARHAAWARRIAGHIPVATAFDQPKSLRDVDRVVRSTRFITGHPRMRGTGAPRYSG